MTSVNPDTRFNHDNALEVVINTQREPFTCLVDIKGETPTTLEAYKEQGSLPRNLRVAIVDLIDELETFIPDWAILRIIVNGPILPDQPPKVSFDPTQKFDWTEIPNIAGQARAAGIFPPRPHGFSSSRRPKVNLPSGISVIVHYPDEVIPLRQVTEKMGVHGIFWLSPESLEQVLTAFINNHHLSGTLHLTLEGQNAWFTPASLVVLSSDIHPDHELYSFARLKAMQQRIAQQFVLEEGMIDVFFADASELREQYRLYESNQTLLLAIDMLLSANVQEIGRFTNATQAVLVDAMEQHRGATRRDVEKMLEDFQRRIADSTTQQLGGVRALVLKEIGQMLKNGNREVAREVRRTRRSIHDQLEHHLAQRTKRRLRNKRQNRK